MAASWVRKLGVDLMVERPLTHRSLIIRDRFRLLLSTTFLVHQLAEVLVCVQKVSVFVFEVVKVNLVHFKV